MKHLLTQLIWRRPVVYWPAEANIFPANGAGSAPMRALLPSPVIQAGLLQCMASTQRTLAGCYSRKAVLVWGLGSNAMGALALAC
jgi:hypothetical protein